MKISLVSDNLDSWIIPYVKRLKSELSKKGHEVKFLSDNKKITTGDVAFFLACENLVKADVLKRSSHNIVIHESKLPQGKGWSPLTWQILEGKNKIPITLFEAELSVDSGDIYLQDTMNFKGDELLDEIKQEQGEKTVSLVLEYVKRYKSILGKKQKGKSTFYQRRIPKDSELDINKSIKEQFNNLRVADNERYPTFFKHKGQTYIIKIYKK